MSDLDHPDEPMTTQDYADAHNPPGTESSMASEPPPPVEGQPEVEASHAHGTNGQVETGEEILSDAAALELMSGVAQNGPARPQPREADLVFPAPVEPPGVPAVLDAVRAFGEQVNGRLEMLQSLVERELRAEMTRERVVDRLHAELQEYKQDLLLKVMRPVFVDLIQLHDDIGKMGDGRTPSADPTEAGPAPDPVKPLLESIRTAIEDILYRQGVEPFEEEQATFDARRQRAVTTVPTEDAELNKTVAVRLRKGFQVGDKVIRPEIVSVYTLKK